MSISPRLSLPYILPQQAQKHVTVNEAVRRLDALVQLSVVSRTVTTEPASPAEGAQYILPAGRTGAAWGAMAVGAIAAFQDGAWTALTPKEGWGAWVEDTNTVVFYDGAAWSGLSTVLGLGAIASQAYETGTFTPAFQSGGTMPTLTYGTRDGVYTRIGRLVFAEFLLTTNSVSGGSGELRIGLPFAAAASTTYVGNWVFYASAWAANANPVSIGAIPGTSYACLYVGGSADLRGGMGGRLQISALATGANANLIYATCIFRL